MWAEFTPETTIRDMYMYFFHLKWILFFHLGPSCMV